MDWLGPVFTALILKLDPTTLVMMVMLSGCAYYHVIWRREDREDKGKLLDTLNRQIEASNGLRNVLSAITGKVQ